MEAYKNLFSSLADINDFIALNTFSFSELFIKIEKQIYDRGNFYKLTVKDFKKEKKISDEAKRIFKEFSNRAIEIAEIDERLKAALDAKDNKKVKLASKSNPIYTTDLYSYNENSKLFNKDIADLPDWIKKTEAFTLDSIFTFIYLQLELYFEEVYNVFNEINKNRYKIKGESLFEVNNSTKISEDKLKEALSRLAGKFLKVGKKLEYDFKDVDIRDSQVIEGLPNLEDLGTQQIISKSMLKLGVFVFEKERLILSYDTKSIVDGFDRFKNEKLNNNLIIITTEYFRLRRNVIAHRERENRFSGSFKEFVVQNGKELNQYWNTILPNRIKHKYLDFQSSEVSFDNYWIMIDALNITKRISAAFNEIFLNLASREDWIHFYNNELQMRRKSNKKSALKYDSQDGKRNMKKLRGYINQVSSLDVRFEEIELYLSSK